MINLLILIVIYAIIKFICLLSGDGGDGFYNSGE